MCNFYLVAGLANKKTVSVTPGSDLTVYLATTKTKKSNKPKDSINRCLLKRDVRRMAIVVENQVRVLHLCNGFKRNFSFIFLVLKFIDPN